ncbi:MAG TPA: MFS transporter [Pilimelia sp.]|nr:MFS transporter [Pilimelia sp.]
MTATAATRRYALLSFLTWLPVGLYLAPMVLLMLERGLSIATVAAVGAAYSVTVTVLELPTGGLADVLGRRPVLVASALASAAGLLLLGLADGLALFLASAVLRGVARALSTGPAEAWYVDTLHGIAGRDVDLTPGLARGEVAASVALAAGTLAGGLLPLALAPGALPLPALAVPVLLAAAVEVARVAVTLRLPEPPHRRAGLAKVLRNVRTTVTGGLRLAATDAVLARVLLAAGGAGVALAAIELLTPAWLGELTGTGEAGALAYAVVAALGFAADAAGGALGPAAVRRCGTPARAAALGTIVAAAALGALAGSATMRGPAAVVLAGLAYCLLFVGLGAAGPAQGRLLHERTHARARATVVSVQSLVLQLAAALGGVTLGWLAARRGFAPAFGVGAALLLASAALFWRLRADRPVVAPPEHTALSTSEEGSGPDTGRGGP